MHCCRPQAQNPGGAVRGCRRKLRPKQDSQWEGGAERQMQTTRHLVGLLQGTRQLFMLLQGGQEGREAGLRVTKMLQVRCARCTVWGAWKGALGAALSRMCLLSLQLAMQTLDACIFTAAQGAATGPAGLLNIVRCAHAPRQRTTHVMASLPPGCCRHSLPHRAPRPSLSCGSPRAPPAWRTS